MRKNLEITSDSVLLIDEDGKSLGVVSRDQALYLAYEKGCDLVEVGPNVRPPVCKLLNYGKYLYELEKQQKKQRAKTKKIEVKEIKLSLKIQKHDFQVKARKAKQFLDQGHKVKAFLQLRGREVIFKDKAKDIFEKFKNEIGGVFEQPIERLGNRFFATIVKK